jgi:outer membrane protein TolC
MNVPPGTSFTVADNREAPLPQVPVDVRALEDLALAQRPELREEDLRKRITGDEARKQLLSMLPGITFDVGPSTTPTSISTTKAGSRAGCACPGT